jgi:hypothetical protein
MGHRVNPPRVASRRAFTPGARSVWISGVSTAQSLDSAPSSPIFAQVEDGGAVIAQRAADQQHITGANLLRPQRISAGMAPMPAVLINSLSAAPRGTTLVSPVTMAIPAARAVSAMLATTASRVAISSPLRE